MAGRDIRRHLLVLKLTAEASSALGGGEEHDVLLWHSSYVRRAGSGQPQEAEAVLKNANNNHTSVRNCYLQKAKYITQEMHPNRLPTYVCMYVRV